MYVPHDNSMSDGAEIRRMVDTVGSAEIITVGPDGTPTATLLPILWSADGSEIIVHLARANPHWQSIEDGARFLAIVAGPQAYISPNWYPSKAEHGKAVPTWNYTAIHFTGAITVHHEPDWLLNAVTELTERHEGRRNDPWAVTDAPPKFINGMLKAIVGLRLSVERVEAKAKLSQNRSAADQAGTITGLEAEGIVRATQIARLMHEG